jgi:DNA-directed RNA polymerase sigma subunit (sigma70/sigma32)
MIKKLPEEYQKEISDLLDKTYFEYPQRFRDNFKRNREIFEYRIGINTNTHTLEETGEKYNLTKERIKQIEYRTINQLIAVSNDKEKIINILRYMKYKRQFFKK